jgi:hypothetical protein
VKDKHSLLVGPSGALTALPFHLLVTDKPVAAIPEKLEGYRDAAWLLRRHAVSSLKALRGFARREQAVKPMNDRLWRSPVQPGFRTTARPADRHQVSPRSVTNLAHTAFWQGAGVDRAMLASALPQLPDTADELNAVAKDLGVAASDIHLGTDASETTVKRSPARRLPYRIFCHPRARRRRCQGPCRTVAGAEHSETAVRTR